MTRVNTGKRPPITTSSVRELLELIIDTAAKGHEADAFAMQVGLRDARALAQALCDIEEIIDDYGFEHIARWGE